MSARFSIHFPEMFREIQQQPLPLPQTFQTLFKNLETIPLASSFSHSLLQISPGDSFQFAYYQTTTSKSYTIHFDTGENHFLFVFSLAGTVTWECAGHGTKLRTEPGRYTGLALRPGRQRLHIGKGTHGFYCIIVSGFRMALTAAEHPYLQPLYGTLYDPASQPATLCDAPITRKVSATFRELSCLPDQGLQLNLKYKQAVHQLLALYNAWLQDREINWRKYTDKIRERALACIAAEYTDPDLDIERIADRLNICHSKLYRAFHRTGYPISQYIADYRIDAACLLLRDTDMPIASVAFQVGYTDPGYFSQAFRRRLKQTPTVFRNRYRPG